MLLLPIIRVVVSVMEDKSPAGLVTSSPRINLFDNAVRSRNDIKFPPLDDFSSLEAEKFVGPIKIASRPQAYHVSRSILLSVGRGGVVICDTV